MWVGDKPVVAVPACCSDSFPGIDPDLLQLATIGE